MELGSYKKTEIRVYLLLFAFYVPIFNYISEHGNGITVIYVLAGHPTFICNFLTTWKYRIIYLLRLLKFPQALDNNNVKILKFQRTKTT